MNNARQRAMEDDQNARKERDTYLESSKAELETFLERIEENTRKGSIEAASKISSAAKI